MYIYVYNVLHILEEITFLGKKEINKYILQDSFPPFPLLSHNILI